MGLKHVLYNKLGAKGKNCLNNTVLFSKYRYKQKAEYEILEKNVIWKNFHKGERCFILGNGPSLKKIDFKMLHNEIIFTVNNVVRVDGFSELRPSYHMWSDPDYFNGGYDKSTTVMEFQKMLNIKGIKAFVPAYALEFFRSNNLASDQIYYFRNILELYDGLNVRIDITKNIHVCRTVVQYAVIIAMYMGFKEIYLLGCDGTSILNVFDAKLNMHRTVFHAYSPDQDEQRENFLKNPVSTEYICYSQYLNFLGWRKLAEYADTKKVKLRNCTKGSLIDSVKYINFERIRRDGK